MKLDLNSSKSYTRLKELMEKYPDEDFIDIDSAILAHAMVYAIVKNSVPETYDKDIQAIKAFYVPVNGKDEPVNQMIVKKEMLQKKIPSLIIESYERR